MKPHFVLLLLSSLVGCAVETMPTAQQESPVLASNVVINEFTAGSSGKIELYNPTSVAIDISNWKVDDIANGGSAPKSVGTSVVLQPGAFVAVSYTGINVSSADQVRLTDPNGIEIDAHSNFYSGSSITGQCYGRSPDGDAWAAGTIPCSLGASNILPAGTVLRGTIVTPTSVFAGEVRIDGDTIKCVAPSCTVPNAKIIETNGIILPGLIDTHNHILFDTFDETDWSPSKIYTNHNQWPNDAKYGAMIDAKQWMNGETSTTDLGCEMEKYGELKGLIAGTTSIVGAANPTNRACYGSLARTIDQSPNDLGQDKIQVATIFPSTSVADSVCNNFASGATDSYVIHIAEGTDNTALSEFGKLGTVTTTDNCLYHPKTTIVHGTALGANELSMMATQGMSLVWSPRSNVFLYGGGTDMSKTTNIPLALSNGVNVSIAPDWSIGGSQNLLDEIRFADAVDAAQWNNTLSSKQIADMVTSHPAHALGLDNVLGSIEVGKKADLVVISGNAWAPYDALLAARPADIKMTIVGGTILYGDLAFESYAPATPGCEHVDICGTQKFLCVAESGGTSSNKFGQTFAEIQSALTSGLQAYDDLHLTQWSFSPIAPLVRCQ